jgi:tetratricopeptide (TPR) repeat protein
MHTELGIFYQQNHLPTKALEVFINALKLSPDYTPAWQNIISLYLQTGNRELADSILSQLLEQYVTFTTFNVIVFLLTRFSSSTRS